MIKDMQGLLTPANLMSCNYSYMCEQNLLGYVKSKAGYLLLISAIAKGVPAHGLVLNHTCCIDLIVYIASEYTDTL